MFSVILSIKLQKKLISISTFFILEDMKLNAPAETRKKVEEMFFIQKSLQCFLQPLSESIQGLSVPF